MLLWIAGAFFLSVMVLLVRRRLKEIARRQEISERLHQNVMSNHLAMRIGDGFFCMQCGEDRDGPCDQPVCPARDGIVLR